MFTAIFVSTFSIGIYVSTRKAKSTGKRIMGIIVTILSALVLLGIYYGVFINPAYRYQALAIPSLVISELFLLTIAWSESIIMRQLHMHEEKFYPLIDLSVLNSLKRNKIIDIAQRWMPDSIKKRGLIEEKRRFQRLDVPLSLRYKEPVSNLWNESLSKNISAGGIQISVVEKMKPGNLLDLMIRAEEDSEPVLVSGLVVWNDRDYALDSQRQTNRYRIGLKFEKIDPFSNTAYKIRRKLPERDSDVKKRRTISKSQILSGLVSISCLLSSIILIRGIIEHKVWVIYIPASLFALIILLSYFFYGLIAVTNKSR